MLSRLHDYIVPMSVFLLLLRYPFTGLFREVKADVDLGMYGEEKEENYFTMCFCVGF